MGEISDLKRTYRERGLDGELIGYGSGSHKGGCLKGGLDGKSIGCSSGGLESGGLANIQLDDGTPLASTG